MEQTNFSNGVPLALSHALMKIQGTSVSTFAVQPISGSQSVNSGGQIRIQVPSNILFDAKTSKLTFSVETSADTSSRIPNGVKTLFERCSITSGGVSIYQGNNFFGIQEYARSIMENKPYNKNSDHGFMAVVSDSQGKALTAGDSESYATGLGKGTMFSVDLGEFANVCPRILDTSLMPQLEITFYLAPNAVLSAPKSVTQQGLTDGFNKVATAGGQTFSITNAMFMCNAYALADGMYSLAMADKIADLGYLEIMYPQTLAFPQAWSGSARLSVGCASLNKLSACFRPNTFANKSAPIPIVGSPFVSADGATADTDHPAYAYDGAEFVKGAGVSEYQSAFQQLKSPITSVTGDYSDVATQVMLQWSVNSSNVPAYQANVCQWKDLTAWANNVDDLSVKSLPEYLNNKFVISYPFNLPQPPWQKPTISGLDTRSSNSYIELKGTNTLTSGFDVLVLAETSSILRVGAGRAIEVIN